MKEWKATLTGALIAVLGMAAGAWLFGGEPAEAQGSGYQRCFFAQQELVDVDGNGDVAAPPTDRTINVPRGWTVVGGGGNHRGDHGTILFCR